MRIRVVALGAVVVLLVLGQATIARADVTSISPSSATVQPGQGAAAQVNIQSESLDFVSASGGGPGITTSLSPDSGAGTWSSTLSVSTSSSTPPGTYTITVSDDPKGSAGSSRTFTLKVQAPPTTTTARPTTTSIRPAPTTTAAPATTATTASATTTTSPGTSSTSSKPAAQIRPFEPVADATAVLVRAPILFLPLEGTTYSDCVDTGTPCTDPSYPVVFLPARTTTLSWQPAGAAGSPQTPPPIELPGVPALQPLGSAPPAPATAATATFLVPILDLTQPGAPVGALTRWFDGTSLITGSGSAGPVIPVATPGAPATSRPPVESSPFGRPEVVNDTNDFVAAQPVVTAYAGTPAAEVLYGLRPPVAWDLNQAFIPLLGDSGGVPRLVRTRDGRAGVALALPTGLEVPAPAATPAPAGSSRRRVSAPALLGLLSTPLLLFLVAWWLRNRRANRRRGQVADQV